MKTLLAAGLLSIASNAIALQPTLLVDDDGGRRYEQHYETWFKQAGLSYSPWETKTMGTPSLGTMTKYRTIFWFTGDKRSALSDEEMERIKTYLDDRRGRRSIMLTGDHIAQDTRNGLNDNHQFLGWYLNARYVRTEYDAEIGVNEKGNVFAWAFLSAIFHGYTSTGDYRFRLWNLADIVKPNDHQHRMVMLPHRNTPEGVRNTLECVAVSNSKHFKTVFVTFDLAHEDSRYINEPAFIKTCIEWLQK
ncbi:hypothetical protein HY639_01485 [Candidatus Woesearchaeota archaeon]|nr:hypothetical protein [Candidatus Woesearchaeota archaeon]